MVWSGSGFGGSGLSGWKIAGNVNSMMMVMVVAGTKQRKSCLEQSLETSNA